MCYTVRVTGKMVGIMRAKWARSFYRAAYLRDYRTGIHGVLLASVFWFCGGAALYHAGHLFCCKKNFRKGKTYES